MGSRVLEKKPLDKEEKNHLTRTTIASTLGIELAYWRADECFCASLVTILLFSKRFVCCKISWPKIDDPSSWFFQESTVFGSVYTSILGIKIEYFSLTCLYCANEIKLMITVPFLQFSFWIYSYTISLTCQVVQSITQVIIITNLRIIDPNPAWVVLGFPVHTNPRAFSLR